jgi:hypothetical protein
VPDCAFPSLTLVFFFPHVFFTLAFVIYKGSLFSRLFSKARVTSVVKLEGVNTD